jgi:hypothetical protein
MKINKSVLIGGIIGGLYALIPFLISLNTPNNVDGLLVLLFPFFPTALTLVPILLILQVFSITAKKVILFDYILNFVNVILWILIGGLIGYCIKKMKKRR